MNEIPTEAEHLNSAYLIRQAQPWPHRKFDVAPSPRGGYHCVVQIHAEPEFLPAEIRPEELLVRFQPKMPGKQGLHAVAFLPLGCQALPVKDGTQT